MPRLKTGAITLAELLEVSREHYKKVDSKSRRAMMDVTNAKLVVRKNYSYNRSTQQWEQSKRKEVKIMFMVRTKPISYKFSDKLPKTRQYPVTFIIRNIDRGMHSAFKWRTGSHFKPIIPTKSDSKMIKERAYKRNIQKGIQMQFFFELSYVLRRYGLLYGPDYTNREPTMANQRLTPFFDKHSYMCVSKILIPMFASDKKQLLMNKIFSKK